MTAETRGTPPPGQPLDFADSDRCDSGTGGISAGWVRRVCKSGLAGVSSYRREILNPVVYSSAGGFEESAGAFARAAVLKDGASRHEDLGASAHDVRDCFVMDAAVYCNAKIEPARLADLREERNLF